MAPCIQLSLSIHRFGFLSFAIGIMTLCNCPASKDGRKEPACPVSSRSNWARRQDMWFSSVYVSLSLITHQDEELARKADECFKEAYDTIRSDGWKVEKQTPEGDVVHSKYIRRNHKIFRITVSAIWLFPLSLPTPIAQKCPLLSLGYGGHSSQVAVQRTECEYRARPYVESNANRLPDP